jgi:hypothetical protein
LLALIAVSFFDRSAQATTPHCLQIPGTTTYAGDACLQRSSYPTLVSPADPRTYGADPTGVKNSAPAFQSAVNQLHDVHVTCPSSAACTYKISDAATQFPVLITHNQNIRCDPNVTLYDPDHDAKSTGMVTFYQVTGGGIQGCNMKGANAGAGPLPIDDNQGNRLVLVEDSSNLLIEGNIFGNTWANSAMSFATGNTGPGGTHTTVQYNTFTANPLYGFSITSGGYDTIQNNLAIDSETGVEANYESNNATAMGGHIFITKNYEMYVNGGCRVLGTDECNSGVGITGGGYVSGYPGGTYAYYGTNSVTANYCTGSGFQNSAIYNTWHSYVSPHPTYSGNILGPGCFCDSGAGSC